MLDEDGNRRDNDERATFLKELPVIEAKYAVAILLEHHEVL